MLAALMLFMYECKKQNQKPEPNLQTPTQIVKQAEIDTLNKQQIQLKNEKDNIPFIRHDDSARRAYWKRSGF